MNLFQRSHDRLLGYAAAAAGADSANAVALLAVAVADIIAQPARDASPRRR